MNIADETQTVFMTLLGVAAVAFLFGLLWPWISRRIAGASAKGSSSPLILIVTATETTASTASPIGVDSPNTLSESPRVVNNAMMRVGAVAIAAAVMTVAPTTASTHPSPHAQS